MFNIIYMNVDWIFDTLAPPAWVASQRIGGLAFAKLDVVTDSSKPILVWTHELLSE
jgi:hypothetical protein